jgi:gas vesicle protein
MGKRVKDFAVGAALAGLAGYVAGILTAPKSGKETRKDIERAATKAKAEAERRLKALQSELGELIHKGRDQAKTASDSAKSGLDDAISRAVQAREKARELLSALHEGDAEDKDLQKAIDDVKDAIEHLKQYLTRKA